MLTIRKYFIGYKFNIITTAKSDVYHTSVKHNKTNTILHKGYPLSRVRGNFFRSKRKIIGGIKIYTNGERSIVLDNDCIGIKKMKNLVQVRTEVTC